MKRKKAPHFLMQSRTVFDLHPRTKVRYSGGKVVWGEWKNWNKHADNKLNFCDAVMAAKRKLIRYHRGTVIYIRRLSDRGRPTKQVVKLFQAKWGHDDEPFIRFDGPVGFWWAMESGLVKRAKG